MIKIRFLILLIFSATGAFACSCAETNENLSKKIKRSFVYADLIITGKVVAIKNVNTTRIKSSADPVIYQFEITKMAKGEIERKTIDIISSRSGASCGYRFKLGVSYLVYAQKSTQFFEETKNKFDFVTSLCSRNRELKKVSKKELRKLKKLDRKKKK